MKSIGIDIGRSNIKVAVVDYSSNSYSVDEFFVLPINSDLTQDVKVNIVDNLRRVVSHYGVQNIKYVFGLKQSDATYRTVSFPFKERHKITKSIPFELEDEIPFDQGDAIFDAKVLKYKGPLTEVLAFTVPNAPIEEAIQLGHEVGIDVDIISLESVALSNLFENWQEPPPTVDLIEDEEEEGPAVETPEDTIATRLPASLIIDIGHIKSTAIILLNDQMIATRTFEFGGHQIIEDLRKKYDIPYPEAHKSLVEKGFVLTNTEDASKDQIVFSDCIRASFKTFFDELKIWLLEIALEHRVNFKDGRLCGGLSNILNISPFFTQSLEISFNKIQHLERHPRLRFNKNDFNERMSGIAIGLALESVKRPRNPAINFRKDQFAKESQSLKNFWIKWKEAIQLGAVCFVCVLIYSYMRDSFAVSLSDASYEALKKQAKAAPFNLKGSTATISGIQKYIRNEKRSIEDKKKLSQLQDINSVMDILLALSSQAPSKNEIELDLKRFFLSEEDLTIEGLISNKSQQNKLEDRLKSLSSDGRVKPLKSTLSPQGKLAFAYSFKVKRREGDN